MKFSKDDNVIIITKKYDELENCRGIVKKYHKGLYYVFLVYPASYQLKDFDGDFIPEWFEEDELEFYYKDDERDYKVRKLLND